MAQTGAYVLTAKNHYRKMMTNNGRNVMTEPKTIDGKLDEILTILNGNGKTGMCAKVNIMWAACLFFAVSITGLLLRVFILP